MPQEEGYLKEKIRFLFQSQSLGVLATKGKVYPYCSLIGFAGTEDLKHIVFATFRSTRKYTNITNHPMISLLIDSRSNRVEDFKDAIAMTVLGSAHEVNGEEREGLSEIYLAKHPHLKSFLDDQDCALIDLKVDKFIIVTRFQEVVEISL